MLPQQPDKNHTYYFSLKSGIILLGCFARYAASMIMCEETMSLFEDSRYCWRETYLVMLASENRPGVDRLAAEIQKTHNLLEIKNLQKNNAGLLEAVTVLSPNDNAAMDIVYQEGEAVRREFHALAEELRKHTGSPRELKSIERGLNFDAKIEILHFEQMEQEKTHLSGKGGIAKITFPRYSSFIQKLSLECDAETPDDFEQAERLDPNTLIQILKLVQQLCRGAAFDPASGTVL
ncbi:MAG: hypothetical protein LBQ54_11925 [Planctomycetaceae bacterium]|nr:hypothetical protein [Planctomycetaceae bacterium]